MSGTSPTDRFVDGFTPAQMPPAAPDGGPELEAAPTDLPPQEPISICLLGPCKRFHLLTSQMDAQQPLDGSRSHLPVFETRTCYPSPGIEFDLTKPVKECSLWEPISKHESELLDARRKSFVAHNGELWEDYRRSWQQQEEDDDASR